MCVQKSRSGQKGESPGAQLANGAKSMAGKAICAYRKAGAVKGAQALSFRVRRKPSEESPALAVGSA